MFPLIRIYSSSSNTGSCESPRILSHLLVICKSSQPCSTAIWFKFAQRTDQGVFQLTDIFLKLRSGKTCVANSPRLTLRDVICIICSLCKINTPAVCSFLNRVIFVLIETKTQIIWLNHRVMVNMWKYLR